MNVLTFPATPLVAVVISLLIAEGAVAQLRTWTDASGTFTVEAEFVDLIDGSVRLKRDDGRVVSVGLERLIAGDQEFAKKAAGEKSATTTVGDLTGKAEELKNDDGQPAGKRSLPMGIASAFKAPGDTYYLTSIRIHGGRYGYPQPPKEDFHVFLCDKDFKLIADFPFPYSRFTRGEPDWVTLRMKPVKVPAEFIICLDFHPERTKGVYISHDAEGKSLVGLPGKPAGYFTGGDWLIRPQLDTLKSP